MCDPQRMERRSCHPRVTNLSRGPMRTRFELGRESQRWNSGGGSGDSRMSCSPGWIGTRPDLSIRRRILANAETKRQRKHEVLTAAAGGDKHEHAFNEDAPLPTARMTELTATHHRTPVGLATRGLLVVVLPPGQNTCGCSVETLSAVPTAGLWCEERDGRTAWEREGVPALTVVFPSPLFVSHTNSNSSEAIMAGRSATKEGFKSLFARARNVAQDQFLKPTAHPTTTTTTPSSSSSSLASSYYLPRHRP